MVRVIPFSQRWRSNSLYCPTGDIITCHCCWDHGVILHIEGAETMSSPQWAIDVLEYVYK